MHIKNIHCTIEKLAETAKCGVEKGVELIDAKEMKEVAEAIKELCEAEYYARISKAMEKAEEDDEKENEYFLRMLKDEYGEEEGEKRYYRGQFRNSRTGRYMRRGRRGYEEYMPDYTMEYLRDMDRDAMGKMYYVGSGMEGGYTRSSGKGGMSYSGNDGREGRSGNARRGYMETKEMHSGNTAQDKQIKMQELEKYMHELTGDVMEMINDASPEERNLLKSKMQTLMTKI